MQGQKRRGPALLLAPRTRVGTDAGSRVLALVSVPGSDQIRGMYGRRKK